MSICKLVMIRQYKWKFGYTLLPFQNIYKRYNTIWLGVCRQWDKNMKIMKIAALYGSKTSKKLIISVFFLS